MKRTIRIIAIILAVPLVAIIAIASYINIKGIPSYTNEAPSDYRVSYDSASIAEGARMASMMCYNCHRSDDGKMGGAYMPDTKEFGKIYSANITQHPEHGITEYTDGELAYLFRTGILKDGQYSPPWMPKFPHLSDKDINNIIAFLRSDHDFVQPSDNQPPKPKASFIAKALTNFVFKPLPWPTEPIPEPDTTDPVAWGKYLSVAKFDCFSCHSADFKTVDIMVPEQSKGYFGGGNPLLDLDGNIIPSPNLTMCEETGIGKWTEEQFIKCVKTGVRPDGRPPYQYPMVPMTQMHDKEAAAIWAYLQTLPVIRNEELASL